MMRNTVIILCAALLTVAALGCSGRPQLSKNAATGSSAEPKWVTHGVNAFPDEVGKAIYGVGIAERKRYPTKYLRRTSAIERGRRDVAAQLRTMVQGVFKDYQEAAFTESMDEAASRGLTTAVQKSVVDETLFGSEVRDLWVEKDSQDYYALVRLDMNGVAEKIRNKMIALEKDRLKVDAAKAHEDLDAIIEKYRKMPLK